MAIGNPITLTSNVASKTLNVIATASQTLFTVTGGYRINEIAVFRNGVRLVDGRDFTARDGTTVTLLSAASAGDVVEFQVFDTFRVADAITPFDSDQTIAGNLNITGILSASQLGSVNFNVTSGIQTFNDVRVGGALTVAGVLTYDDVTNVDSIGVITARSGINIVGGGLTATGVSTFFSEVRVGTASSNNAFVNINPPSGHGDQYVMRLRNDGDNSTKLLFANKSAGLGQIWYQEAFRFVDDADSDAERLRIDSSGRLLVGTTSDISGSSDTSIQVVHTGGGRLVLGRNDSSVTDGNDLGVIGFYSNDDSGYQEAARIYAEADGTFANDDKPGRLVFATTDDNSTQVVERLRIDSSGTIKYTGVRTGDETNKLGRFIMPSHDTNEEDVMYFQMQQEATFNQLELGGGSATYNAATLILFRTAAIDTTTGTERLRITSDGKLGVNTASPGCQTGGIHAVHDATEGTPSFTAGEVGIFQRNFNSAQSCEISIVSGTASKSTINFGDKDDVNVGMIEYENSNNAFVFTTNTSERLRITSDGDVGIGTDDPQQFVHIHDPGASGIVTTRIQQESSNTPTDGGAFLQLGGTRSTGNFGHYGGIFGGRRNQAADNTGYLAFHVDNDDGESMSERVRITHQGRIGIGTDDPQGLLVIQGDSNDSTTPSVRLQDGTDARQVSITNNAGDFVVSTHGADNSHHGQIKIFEGGQISLFNGGGSGSLTERLRIATDGSVTKPTNALFQSNMGSTYGSAGSLVSSPATAILQSAASIDRGNTSWTTSGTNAYTFVCPVDGIYAVHAHFSLGGITAGGGSLGRIIFVLGYTAGGGNLPLDSYVEMMDVTAQDHMNYSYYNTWNFTAGTRVGAGMNGVSGSQSAYALQWGIHLLQ